MGKGLAEQLFVNKADGYEPWNDDFYFEIDNSTSTLLPFERKYLINDTLILP